MTFMDENSLVNPETTEKIDIPTEKEETVKDESTLEQLTDNVSEEVKEGEESEETPQLYDVAYKDGAGKDVKKKVPVEELIKDYQLRQASYERFQQAKDLTDSATQALKQIEQDPISVHRQLYGADKTKEYLWGALTAGDTNFIDTLIEVYGSEHIQPHVVKWVNKVMEEEHIKANNPEEYKRRLSYKEQEKQFLTERQKMDVEKRQVEDWKRKKEEEEQGKLNETTAKKLFIEVQDLIKKNKLPEKVKKADGSFVSMVSIVGKYMEIYENLEGRQVTAEETIQRMKDDFYGLGIAQIQALPNGELLTKQPDLAGRVQQAVKEKISSTRSTKPKRDGSGERKQQSTSNSKVIPNVHKAPWRSI